VLCVCHEVVTLLVSLRAGLHWLCPWVLGIVGDPEYLHPIVVQCTVSSGRTLSRIGLGRDLGSIPGVPPILSFSFHDFFLFMGSRISPKDQPSLHCLQQLLSTSHSSG
jgi:hypothetical protein